MESGVHSSLHENCHHQITFAKFNLKIYYPPPYEREVWHYQKANSENIRKAINEFPWERRFSNSDDDEKVYLFNKTIKNIVYNYIPHETIICNDRDPPWINKNIKKFINDKNHAYKCYRQNENNSLTFQNFQFLQSKLNSLIEESKHKYHARLSKKLSDPATSPKSYWSILKTFLNNKKIPCIPPLLHENKFIIDFRSKAEIFNTFFAKQCSLINTSSVLPTTLIMKTRGSLSTIRFTSDDILKIIRNLDPNKAHGHDMISIRMVKLCDASLCKPLELIFKSCLESGKFPLEWKKANVVPAHKKGDKQLLKNYRPISLLPIDGKIFERILYNNMFEFFTKNHLISHSQSGFKSGDSCINQLLSITHEIYKSFDDGLDVRGVFLDISKAFDKVWHKGLLYQRYYIGFPGYLTVLLASDFYYIFLCCGIALKIELSCKFPAEFCNLRKKK